MKTIILLTVLFVGCGPDFESVEQAKKSEPCDDESPQTGSTKIFYKSVCADAGFPTEQERSQ